MGEPSAWVKGRDVHLSYKLGLLYDRGNLGAFKPASREVLLNFAAEMVESPGDPAALHAAWRHLSIDYVVRQFEKPVVSVIRDFEAPRAAKMCFDYAGTIDAIDATHRRVVLPRGRARTRNTGGSRMQDPLEHTQ